MNNEFVSGEWIYFVDLIEGQLLDLKFLEEYILVLLPEEEWEVLIKVFQLYASYWSYCFVYGEVNEHQALLVEYLSYFEVDSLRYFQNNYQSRLLAEPKSFFNLEYYIESLSALVFEYSAHIYDTVAQAIVLAKSIE